MRARMGTASLLIAALSGCQAMDLKPGAQSVFEFARPPSPLEAAEMATDKYDPDKRYRGTILLSSGYFAGEDAYVHLFEAGLEDADPGVRAASIRALGLHGEPAHAARIVKGLTDEDPLVRTESARALQRLHNPAAVEGLMAALDEAKEQDAGVRIEAARALGQYAERRVVERLIAALRDEKLAVNHATRESLRTLTGQDFGLDRGAWQRWYKDTPGLFDARRAYVYPAFHRDKRWYEYIPFLPPPPNEPSAMPAGLSGAEFADPPAAAPAK